ncbi:hypothetical protein CY34DRAFT_802561 [Suillus luteus UH-Slu-Lm8-n1]|uniref:Uncharacterized protein n=1 Tax=Suillus luteus UH-Slu-Lm8-n1 TaxID=930992 RepID=A0A0D0B3S2_9AGAM|nr:hypothetical protein CY34DRAFT_802561 [Suillus luteus UH-Slu-Lm8-n1]
MLTSKCASTGNRIQFHSGKPQHWISGSKIVMRSELPLMARNPSLLKTTRGGRAKWRKITKLSYGRSRESRFLTRGRVCLGHADTIMTEIVM